MANSKFLGLPVEIRQQIYGYAVPTCRLAPFVYSDPEWTMRTATSEHRGVPEFIFTCRKLYEELAPIVYARAILEVAPAQQSYCYFDIKLASTERIVPYTYTRIVSTFRIYKPDLLRCVRRVHVFSNQADVVDGQSYECLLQWLADHTGVSSIQLSTRPMTRIRGKADFDLDIWRHTFAAGDMRTVAEGQLRMIRIWTKAKRPPWEYEKMMRLRCKATDGTLNPLQIYFMCYRSSAGQSQGAGAHDSVLQLDPRWLTRLNDEPKKVAILEEAAPLIDNLMYSILHGLELQNYRTQSRHRDGELWVYQMVVVTTT